VPALSVLPAPWNLAIPTGPKAAADGIAQSINTSGDYHLDENDGVWLVERKKAASR